MRLLITENTDTKQLFQELVVSGKLELVTDIKLENSLKKKSFQDFTLLIIDATKNTGEVSQYFKQIQIHHFELKKIFIILENPSFVDEFVILGIHNFLFKPLELKIIELQFSRAEKDLADFNLLISENKKKDKNTAKLEKTLQLMPDGVVIVDANAVITYTNSQITQLFGYEQEELIGKDIESLVHSKDRNKHIGYRNNYINNPKIRPMGSQLEVFGLRKDGSSVPVDISLSPIRIEEDFFIVSTIKDINERKNIQLELNKTKEAAEAANRAKSVFLANMSHEIRTPLNAILGYAQILLRDRGLNQKQNEEIKIIKASGEHLLGLISDILDVSKIEAGKMELNPIEFNLTDFINGIADIFKIRANEKGLSFHYEVMTKLPHYVNSDEKKLRQILFNLLSNALKFTEKGKITLKSGQKENKIVFQVEDNGIGIELDKQKEIFKPFTQVSTQSLRAEGTGLGLSISQKLAHILGSEIKVKSVPGEGSNFYFEVDLPAIERLNISPELDEKVIVGYKPLKTYSDSNTSIKDERKKILIADDKCENRSVLLNLLLPLDFIVFEAIDGFDCLAKCLEYKPDMIFLDLRMPNMDGYETTRKIRLTESIKDTLIIAISASAFETDSDSSIEVGCNEFIAKPFRQEKIFQSLKRNLNIEWIYEEISKDKETDKTFKSDFNGELLKENISVPEAERIKELALMGDVEEILSFLKVIEKKDTQYLPIIEHIQKMAKNFEFEKILNLVDEKMIPKGSPGEKYV